MDQFQSHQKHDCIGQGKEDFRINPPRQRSAGQGSQRRKRHQQHGCAEIGRIKLAQQEIGHQLHGIDRGKEGRRGRGKGGRAGTQLQGIDLIGWRARMGHEAGEPGHCAPERAAHPVLRQHPVRLAKQTQLEITQSKPRCDQTHDQPHRRIRHMGRERPADRGAQQRTGKHGFQGRIVLLAAPGPHREHVHHHEDGKQDRSRLNRRDGQRHDRHAEHAERTTETALRQPDKRDRQDGGDPEGRIGHDAHAGSLFGAVLFIGRTSV